MDIKDDGTETVSKKPEQKINGDEVEGIIKPNPLLLSPVIKCIYKYLGLEDIKNCRFVSREWKLNSYLVLRDRSKIVLSNVQKKDQNFTISKFLEDFSETKNIPFNAFKFTNVGSRWKVKELNEFFEGHQQSIKELELDRIYLEGEGDNLIAVYNITQWITKSLLTNPNTKSRTKLSLNCREDWRPVATLVLLQSVLTSIQDISLMSALMDIKNSTDVLVVKMKPINLKLDDVRFCSEGKELKSFRVNTVVDFSKCKSIYLKSAANKIKVDFGGDEKINIDKVTLIDNVTGENWSNSSWQVNELIMFEVPFTNFCGMKIIKLDHSWADIDLSCLPQSIEILNVKQMSFSSVRCNNPISLPNLKILYLKLHDIEKFEILKQFKNCPNLVDIHINGGFVDEKTVIKVDWIPNSCRRFKIIKMAIVWEEVGQGQLHLDQLVFQDCAFENVKLFCITNIQVQDMIICFTFRRGPNYHIAFYDLIKSFKNSSKQQQAQRIFVGPIQWDKQTEFSRISVCLKKFVDKMAEYYVFENLIGRAIEKKELDDLENITF